MLMTGAPLSATDAVSSGFAAAEGTLDDALTIAITCAAGNPATITSIKDSFA